VKAFLKTDRFVLTSPNAYNQLGLGTTQLYNKRVVYNQKRHGTFLLGNRMVTFERRLNVPKQLSPEFLLVDLVNELGDLAEDRGAVLSRVREKAKEMDPRKLSRAVSLYGKYSTQKKVRELRISNYGNSEGETRKFWGITVERLGKAARALPKNLKWNEDTR
jgi:hypothetical protein